MSRLRKYPALSGFLVLLLASSSALDRSLAAAPSDVEWNKAETQSVKLTDFAFSPAYLRFQVGRPVHLVVVNEGSGEHDFSAPEFFSAVKYGPGSSAPADGRIEIGKNETKELELLPVAAGSYKLKCTHFLHTVFGMHGVIEVIGEPH